MRTDSIDTNIVIYSIAGEDPIQRKLSFGLLGEIGVMHHLSTLTISEVVYVFEKTYGKSRKEITNLVTFFLDRFSEHLAYDRKLVDSVFPIWLDHPKLSFVDCLLATEAELSKNEPLWTFDKKLAKQMDSAKLLQ